MKDVTRPRGRGTYVARIETTCAEHGRHEVELSADDDLAWVMAKGAAARYRSHTCGGVRVITWFIRETPIAKRRPRPEPTGEQIEDDIPF